MKAHFLVCLSILTLVISSWSVQMEQPATVVASPTFEPGSAATLPSEGNPPQTNVVTTTNIPVGWADLHLTGRLVYINGTYSGDIFGLQIQILNLVTGEVTTIFNAPKYSWIYYISVSPDYKQVFMSYAPPPGENLVDQDIYVMPIDGSKPPQLLFTPPTRDDQYIEAEPSPDGKYIYFTHVNYQIPQEPGQVNPLYTIYRLELPDGQPEKVVEKGYWPRVSPDSSKLVYISVDPHSSLNKLYMADSDGGNAQEVVITGPHLPDIKDAPLFSPDGQSIIYSAALPLPAYQPNWLDKVMGVRIAKAHGGVASDWWSIPVGGGISTQLTNIQTTNLFASFAPDGRYVASYSTGGIFVMKPDGSELTMLIPNDAAIPGTVSWIP